MLLQLLSGACFIAAGSVAGIVAWRFLRQRQAKPSIVAAAPTPGIDASRLSGSAENWCKVLDGETLLQRCHAQSTLDELLRQSRLAPEVFNRELRSALVAYAEFVQLAPASESHHHAHPGGLLAHTLEVILGAMTLRNGYLLPLHAATELIDRQRDHWTFTVFLAALLHDIGKIMTDLRLHVRDTPKAPIRRWLPMSGALTQSRATEYRIGFAPTSERDYLAHKKLALVLLQGIVPPNALAFIGRENLVLESLTCFLGGEEKPGSAAADGAKTLAQIIKKADQHSVAHNLQQGPRHRFSSATSVPLIERLMSAIRGLLAQGTALPLNRSGAAGWVHDGALWFVAKRLTDTVRATLQKDDPDEGLPGPAKNDRLFDAFQDYGVIEINPATGQAIWYVMVSGDGYAHRLSMLKFPLHRLYDDPARYPAPMQGCVTPLARDEGVTESQPEFAQAPVPEAERPPAQTRMVQTSAASSEQPAALTPPPPKAVHRDARPGTREPCDEDLIDDTESVPAPPPAHDPALMVPRPSPPATGGPSSPKSGKSGRGEIPAPRPPSAAKRTAVQPMPPLSSSKTAATEMPKSAPEGSKPVPEVPAPATNSPSKPLVVGNPLSPAPLSPRSVAVGQKHSNSHLLDDADAIQSKGSRRNRKANPPAAPMDCSGAPVSPYAVAPKLGTEKEPSLLAIAFMEWVQQGLAGGSLLYNEPGAPIHFIPQGMALVSPRIFREYALAVDESADAVQQQVIGAGWHVKASKNNNILHFAVVKRDGMRAGKLSAVVINQPERWVNPLPTANLCIVPFELSVDPAAIPVPGKTI